MSAHRLSEYAPAFPTCATPQRNGFGDDHFADLLDAAHQHLAAPIVLVWKGLPAHKSAKMHALIADRPWLRAHRLHGYAPELNPVENMWSSLTVNAAWLTSPGRADDLHCVAKAVLTDAIPAHHRLRIPRHQRTGTILTLTPKLSSRGCSQSPRHGGRRAATTGFGEVNHARLRPRAGSVKWNPVVPSLQGRTDGANRWSPISVGRHRSACSLPVSRRAGRAGSARRCCSECCPCRPSWWW